MYEYKVDIYKVKYAQDAMNTYAAEGWRVIAVAPDHITGFVDVFFEREVSGEAAVSSESLAEKEEQIEHIDPSEYPEDPSDFDSDIWDFSGEKKESEVIG